MPSMKLSDNHQFNVSELRVSLRIKESFDLIERHLKIAGRDACFFYIDGFVKDGEMLRIMQDLLTKESLGTAAELVEKIPYVEVERVEPEQDAE